MGNYDVIVEIVCGIVALACADPVANAWEKILLKRMPEGKKSRRTANGLMLLTIVPALAGIALIGFELKITGLCLIGVSVFLIILLIILYFYKKHKIKE